MSAPPLQINGTKHPCLGLSLKDMLESWESYRNGTMPIPTQQTTLARHSFYPPLGIGKIVRWRCSLWPIVLIPTSRNLMTNLYPHRESLMSGKAYRTSKVLFPSPQIAIFPQPNHPGAPNPLLFGSWSSCTRHGKLSLLPTTPDQPSQLVSTGILSPPLSFVF